VILSACSSSKEMAKVPELGLSQVIEGLKSHVIYYDFFYGKARIKYNGEEVKVGGRSTIMMISDSLIWMNMKKLSIEGVRTLIEPDSTWILYRQDKICEQGSTQDFLDFYKIYVPFRELQDILVGNVPIPELADVQKYASDTFYKITFDRGNDHYQYWLNENFTIHTIVIKDILGRIIQITHSDYNEDNFATRKEIEVEIPGESVSKVSIKFSKVEFDIPKTIKFEIPPHYTVIP